MRREFRRAQAIVDSLRIDVRGDDKSKSYDSDSSDDSPSPTKSKFPTSVTESTPPTTILPTTTFPTTTFPTTMLPATTTAFTETAAPATALTPDLPPVTGPAAQTTDTGQQSSSQQKQDATSKGLTQTDITIIVASLGASSAIFALFWFYFKRRRRNRARFTQPSSDMLRGHQYPPEEKMSGFDESPPRKLSFMQRPDSETLPANPQLWGPKSRVPSATPTAWPTSNFDNTDVTIHPPPAAAQPYPRMTPAPDAPRSQAASIVYYPINPTPAGMPPPPGPKTRVSVAMTDATWRTSGTWNTWGIEQHR